METTERGHTAIRKVIETLADLSRLPAVFHCVAGKDRTGIIAALTLALLGMQVHAYNLRAVVRFHQGRPIVVDGVPPGR